MFTSGSTARVSPRSPRAHAADSLTYTDHAYDDGSFTGTFNGVNFTVTFTNGVAEVTGTAAEGGSGAGANNEA